MKKRNPLAVFLLSIVTFGIYDLYWLAKTRKELNDKTSIKIPSIWILFIPAIIAVVAVIALLIASFAHSGATTTFTQVKTINGTTTTTTVNTGSSSSLHGAVLIFLIVYIMDMIALVVVGFMWFLKFSKAVNEYTSGKMSTGVTFLLTWFLHLIGVAIVQDAFNGMIDHGQAPGVAPAAMSPMMPAQSQNQPMADPNENPEVIVNIPEEPATPEVSVATPQSPAVPVAETPVTETVASPTPEASATPADSTGPSAEAPTVMSEPKADDSPEGSGPDVTPPPTTS